MKIIDSYSEINQENEYTIYSGSNYKRGQSFANTSEVTLDSCKWYLKKTGSPTGNAVAKIYAHTGTYGTSSQPTGLALATSDTFDVSTLTTSFQLINFNFSGTERITLSASTYYVVIIEYDGGDSSNKVYVGADSNSPAHGGNGSQYSSFWLVVGTVDYIFYVYGEPSNIKSINGITKSSVKSKNGVLIENIKSINGVE